VNTPQHSQGLIKITFKTNGVQVRALVDCGAQGNFISKVAMLRAGLQPTQKADPYEITMANGHSKWITHEVYATLTDKHESQTRVTLDVFELATHDIILGLPWLQDQNPVINWKKRTVLLEVDQSATTPTPAQRTTQLADERMILNINSTNKMDGQTSRIASTKMTMVFGHRVGEEEHRALLKIPAIYLKRFIKIFVEKKGPTALPEHKPWDCTIPLQEGKEPGFQSIYQLSEKELKEVKKFIDEMMKKGYIRPSTSPAGFPILFVPKKDGSLRMCVDFRRLNDITIKNRYPLPNIQELRDRTSGAKYFTCLDLRDGYHLIRMKEGEEWKTAFRCRYGHYEYTVMPFGLTNAPAVFQALVNNVLRDCLDVYVVAYLDDILIYSQTLGEHEKHVADVLQRLLDHDLQVKPKKCEFHKEEVEFLGHIVGRNGIRMSDTKIKTVIEWEAPKTVKDVQSFLGFINFNRQFIKDFSKKALPLSKLTRKDTGWKWDSDQKRAFEELKEACIQEPVLIAFTSGKPLRFETDASDLALGAVMLQEKDAKWHPVGYHSRKFSSAEENYDVHDKELLAIVDALSHWRIYAESCSELTIFSDHKNLVNFTTTKKLGRRQVRWSQELGQHKFKIVYTPGKDNGRADALSRRHDVMGKKTNVEMAILKENKDGSLSPSNESNDVAVQLNNVNRMDIRATPPEELHDAIIQGLHDNPVYGHPGVTRTIELIQRYYQFKNIKEKVARLIKKCADCQRNKHNTHAPYGDSQPMELPSGPWEDISMDFVTGLPLSTDPVTKVKYDAIMVVVCRFTKYAEMLPFRRDYTATDLAHVFKDRIFRHHGIPKSIISDRDKLFTSNYWATFVAEIGIKRKLSTAYHPETDGQTERTNRTMKTYLKIYSNHQQNNWVSLLPMAQIAYNNKLSEATGKTPFFAYHGKHPNLFDVTYPSMNAEAAHVEAEKIQTTYKEMRQSLEKAQNRRIETVNKKRKMAPQLKRGDKVYLLTKNLRTKRPSKGLDHVKVGPFLILSKHGATTYTLDLPKDAKIHPRFHVKLLEPADPDTPLQKTFRYEPEEETEYEVEALLDYREIGREDFRQEKFLQEWLVKWKGYPDSENTWEPESNLQNCKELLRKARKKQGHHFYTGISPEQWEKIQKRQTKEDEEATLQKPEVEAVLSHRDEERIKCRMYLIKWKGHDYSKNTWEPEQNLGNCQAKIQEYWNQNPHLSQAY